MSFFSHLFVIKITIKLHIQISVMLFKEKTFSFLKLYFLSLSTRNHEKRFFPLHLIYIMLRYKITPFLV